jgi:hypothetical protein
LTILAASSISLLLPGSSSLDLSNSTSRELQFPTSATAKWLANVDLALCFSPVAHAEVATLTPWREPRTVLLGRSHPLATRTGLELAGVLDEPFYGHAPGVDTDGSPLVEAFVETARYLYAEESTAAHATAGAMF